VIDLHTHTDHSDGSSSPEELLRKAESAGLRAIAITDHDTLSGNDEAARLPKNLELIRGIELTTKYGRPTVHLLGYFLHRDPGQRFRQWLDRIHAHRRERNALLADRLQQLGVEITLEEVELVGMRMTGRPHFAKVLIQKGYVRSYEEAFQRYLGENGSAFVHREAPSLEEGIRRIREAGGVPSIAHPVRLQVADQEAFFASMREAGLLAVEVFHSDHSPELSTRYLRLAQRLELAVTGGSDYHGLAKPQVHLGRMAMEWHWLEKLRELTA
jgi:hypothetical protein